MLACENSGYKIDDDFLEVRKIVIYNFQNASYIGSAEFPKRKTMLGKKETKESDGKGDQL